MLGIHFYGKVLYISMPNRYQVSSTSIFPFFPLDILHNWSMYCWSDLCFCGRGTDSSSKIGHAMNVRMSTSICSAVNWSMRTTHGNGEGLDPCLIISESADLPNSIPMQPKWCLLAGYTHWSAALGSSAFFASASHVQLWFLFRPYSLTHRSTNSKYTTIWCVDALFWIATTVQN